MIEMPLNRTTPGATPGAAANEPAADAPDGAFAEMLSRNLGRGLVRRTNPQKQESDQDAAQGGTQGGTQFYQGTTITPWAPSIPVVSSPGTPATAEPVNGVGAEPAALTVDQIMTPAARAVAARYPGATTVAATTQTIADAAAATAGVVLDQNPTGTAGIAAGPSRIEDPWQSTQPQAAPQHAVRLQPASPQTVTNDGGALQPSLIGEPSSGPGVLDSPRLETAAMPTASSPVPQTTPGGAAGLHAAATSGTLEAAPATVTDATAAAAADFRASESTEPATTATPLVDPSPGNATAALHQPPSRPVAAPNTQLVNRVLRMVEYQQTQPPPRMVVVDMPELEGLRLMVAVQADGKVHVAPIAGSAPQQVTEPFLHAVGEALSAEGFNLAADSQQGQRRDRPESNEPTPTPRRTVRRRRATGLRL